MQRAVYAVVVMVGCGRIAFDPVGDGGGDGGTRISLELPAGGQFNAVAVGPDGTAYAISRTTGVYRTDAAAMTWMPCGALVGGTAVAVAGDNSVFVSGAKIMRSTDGCATWVDTNAGRISDNVVVANGVVWAITDVGLLRWNGSAWGTVTTPLDNNRFFSLTRTATTYIAGTAAGIVYSPNGVNWTAVTAGLPSIIIAEVAAGPTRAYAIQSGAGAAISCGSADGTTWTQCGSPGGYGLLVDPNDDQHVLAAVYDDLVVTTNAFGSLTRLQRGPLGLDEATVLDLVSAPNGATFAATDRGVYRSPAGGGIAFAPVFSGLRAWDIDVMLRDGDDVYLATRGGVLHSAGGAPFTISTVGFSGNTTIQSLAVVPDGTLFASGRNIFSSNDRGQTWTMRAPLDIPDQYLAYALEVVGTRIYAGTATRVLYSDPPYTVWSPLMVGTMTRTIRALRAVDGVLYAGATDGIWASMDGGMSFTNVAPGFVLSLVRLADSGIAAGTTNGVVLSDPTRMTWMSSGLTGRNVRNFLEVGTTLVATTDNGVAYSTERGASWQALPGAETMAASAALYDGQLVLGSNSGLVRVPLP